LQMTELPLLCGLQGSTLPHGLETAYVLGLGLGMSVEMPWLECYSGVCLFFYLTSKYVMLSG